MNDRYYNLQIDPSYTNFSERLHPHCNHDFGTKRHLHHAAMCIVSNELFIRDLTAFFICLTHLPAREPYGSTHSYIFLAGTRVYCCIQAASA